MENLDKIQSYRSIIQQIFSQYASYKPSYGDVEMQTLFDTEHDHYQVLAIGWSKEERIYGCSMHLDIKNDKIWIQTNNTELDIAQALIEMGVPKTDIVIGFQPVYIRQVSGYAIA
jgi:XisI protein